MRLILVLLFSVFFVSCSLSPHFFSANLISSELSTQIKTPTIEIKKNKAELKLQPGVYFLSFSLINKEDAAKILSNENIATIWQISKEQPVTTISADKAYFLEVSAETKLSWNIDESQKYNSNLVNTGDNFLSLNRGLDPLLIQDIKVNGQNLIESINSIKTIIDNFYITDNNSEFYDLLSTEKDYSELSLLAGTGVYVKAKAFAKISWSLSEYWLEQEAKINEQKQAEIEKIKNEQEKERIKNEDLIDKEIKQRNRELIEKVFMEVKDLPLTILKMIKDKNKEQLTAIIANKNTLLQVHENATVINNLDYLTAEYWLNRTDLIKDSEYKPSDRLFEILELANLKLINNNTRAIVYLKFAKSESEIDRTTGIFTFYEGIAFIRNKDCSWAFDPITTMTIEQKIKNQTNFYSEDDLLKFLETSPVVLNANIDFTNIRKQCEPDVKSVAQRILNKYEPWDTNKQNTKVKEEKLLHNHTEICEELEGAISNLDTLSLENFIYDDPEEKQITGLEFPKLAFNLNICKNYWPYALNNPNFTKIMSNKYEGADANLVLDLIIDDSFYLYLGSNPVFDCKNIADADKKDYCYFGQSINEKSALPCKKIKSNTVKSYCAGNYAQNKNSYELSCEKVFGVYDKKKDKNNELKIGELRNCRLDMVSKFVTTKKDCNVFKKKFLFFFRRSTPSYEHCLKVLNKEFATGFVDLGLTEDDLLIEMKIKEPTTNEEKAKEEETTANEEKAKEEETTANEEKPTEKEK